MHTAVQLACPIDQLPLEQEGRRFHCGHGHSFDLARLGYLHLLPVQQKRSRFPGDSAAMIEARQRFLNAGFFKDIAKAVAIALTQHVEMNAESCILDAGCGEGYYLDYLSATLAGKSLFPGLVGLDVGKPGIIAAARRNKNVAWLVASNRRPPLLPRSVDGILCMFGFPVFDRFKELLKPGGKVLLVESGPQHLIELRDVIYEETQTRGPPDLGDAEAQGFEMVKSDRFSYPISLNEQTQIADLLMMTPHLFRAPRRGKERAAGLAQIDLTVDVVFRLLQVKA